MKKRLLKLIALAMTVSMFAVGCGSKPAPASNQEEADQQEDQTQEEAPQDDTQPEQEETSDEDTPNKEEETVSGEEETDQPEMESVAELNYSNVNYDFAQQIAAEREAVKLIPDVPEMNLTVSDAKGATGVQLVASLEEGNTTDFFLNALVAGNELNFTAKEDAEIASASSSVSGDISVENGSFTYIPAPIKAAEPTDEIITVTMGDGAEYRVHTVNESMPGMVITGSGVDAENAGVYNFALYKFLLRVNT